MSNVKTFKKHIDQLIVELAKENSLTATQFFKSARSSNWGRLLDGRILVEQYNEGLGRAFGRGALTMAQVNWAMQP